MKIIAIRPLKGCDKTYLKNLTPDEPYYFYDNYQLDGETLKIGPGLPEDFYHASKPMVNISAVVGKNGSGKSTVIELLLRAINNISEDQDRVIADLVKVRNLRVEIFFQTNRIYKVRIFDDRISYYQYVQRTKLFAPSDKLPLRDFFYTIAVNYSHYAYNAKDIPANEDWLTGVFHKNDGYQTPLVLNPYRKDGIININTENDLLKGRLIANLLRFPEKEQNYFRSLTPIFDAHQLQLSLNPSKEDAVLYQLKGTKTNPPQDVTLKEIFDEEGRDLFLKDINRTFRFGYRAMKADDKQEYKLALDYVAYKVISIAIKYYNLSEIVFIKDHKNFNSVTQEKYLKQLHEDKSHITLKLRQTLNYLRFKPEILQTEKPIDLTELSKFNHRLLRTKTQATEGIELIPPPIYHTEIIMCKKDDPKDLVPFQLLSSGEKQMIYSVHSLLYHLSNLDSVRRSSLKRTAFRYFNIILEEVELYAHPEMQRVYINYIIDSLKELSLHETAELNIIFVTHSPFILSDIPKNNILFLEANGTTLPEGKRMQTFGGNIHDLLATSFFLDEGTIGAFALNKIDQLIAAVQPSKQQAANDAEAKPAENKELLKLINLVGEPFLKEKLLDMYYTKYDKQKRIDQLEAELKKLRS